MLCSLLLLLLHFDAIAFAAFYYCSRSLLLLLLQFVIIAFSSLLLLICSLLLLLLQFVTRFCFCSLLLLLSAICYRYYCFCRLSLLLFKFVDTAFGVCYCCLSSLLLLLEFVTIIICSLCYYCFLMSSMMLPLKFHGTVLRGWLLPGISNMTSSRSFSMIALRPRAPVLFWMASLAMAFSASPVNFSSTCTVGASS